MKRVKVLLGGWSVMTKGGWWPASPDNYKHSPIPPCWQTKLTIQHINHKTALTLANVMHYTDISFHTVFFRNYEHTLDNWYQQQMSQESTLTTVALPGKLMASTSYLSLLSSAALLPTSFLSLLLAHSCVLATPPPFPWSLTAHWTRKGIT